MIRVIRGAPLEGFSLRVNGWYADFEAARIKNPSLTVSQFWGKVRPKIREDAECLARAFREKCAFCESKMRHVSAPHVEHYRPKKRFPDQAFVWENWLLSCGTCNSSKWEHFPDCDGQPCLIDPTIDDPEEHLEFSGYFPVSKTKRGATTIALLGLDRSPLEDERSRWLSYINALLLLCCSGDVNQRAEARELLIWAMQDDAPYTAMVRCYLQNKTPRLANPGTPHLRVTPQDPIQRIQALVDRMRPELADLK